jgi:23S rRNA (pseudouridine1915-N3)-methyltransferase
VRIDNRADKSCVVNITVISTGNRMPDWVEQAGQDFIRRLPPEIRINLVLQPLVKRGKNPDIQRIVRDESRKLLTAVPKNSRLLVLDVAGKQVSTQAFADMLQDWQQQGQDIAIIIGGPDGVSDELLSAASQRLSLSRLTFPHPLVRVILLEQLYRAWSIVNNHPYHRG